MRQTRESEILGLHTGRGREEGGDARLLAFSRLVSLASRRVASSHADTRRREEIRERERKKRDNTLTTADSLTHF